jgi:uncharacterized protein YndB with AHSA1/START domain
MAEVGGEVEIAAPLAEVWQLYFDAARWGSWVDGFARLSVSDGYPERGGTLVWESTPAGRGRVSERVLEHEPRRLHRISYSDPGSVGELETRFEMMPAGEEGRRTLVSQRQRYQLHDGGPLAALTDRLFIRSQMRGSLQRSLAGLRAEAAARAPARPCD